MEPSNKEEIQRDNENADENNQNIDNQNGEEEEEEELEDDIALQELHFRLSQIRQERKGAEENAKLLDNRVNMLKGEEEKTWKKIESTKKKTNERLIHLQSLADLMRQKEYIKKKKEEEIKERRNNNLKLKKEMKDKIELKKAEKRRQIQEEAKLLRIQKEYNQQLITYINKRNLDTNKSKCEFVKSQHSREKERKMIIEKERKARLRAELERQLLEEYRLKEEAEERKAKTEQEEVEILKRLKTTTQLHQDSKNFFNLL